MRTQNRVKQATTVLPTSGLARFPRASTSSWQVECHRLLVQFSGFEAVDVDVLSSIRGVECECMLVARNNLVWAGVRAL